MQPEKGQRETGSGLSRRFRSVEGRSPTPTLLHTAASLYAETGKSVEAREVLLQSIALRGDDEPHPNSWYVFGRIAENYGGGRGPPRRQSYERAR